MHLYKLVNASEAAALEDSLRRKLHEWASDWLNSKVLNIKISNAFSYNIQPEVSHAHYNKNGLIVLADSGVDGYLSNLFGTTELLISLDLTEIRRVYDASFDDLVERVRKDIIDSREEDTNNIFKNGSGWVIGEINFEDFGLKLFFKPIFSPPPEKSDKKLYSLMELVRPEKIVIDIFMGGTEITAGELDQLQVGDVLELKHKINEPLKVVTQEGLLVGNASLGKLQDNYAISYFINKS